jgi:prolipoprotein diacylglyceryltransferase
MMALYLMLNGIERFFIEKIRVNNEISFLGMQMTQAELISALLFLAGLGLWIWLTARKKTLVATSATRSRLPGGKKA